MRRADDGRERRRGNRKWQIADSKGGEEGVGAVLGVRFLLPKVRVQVQELSKRVTKMIHRPTCDSSVSSTLQAFFEEIAELPDFCGITPIGLNTRGNFGLTPLHLAAIRGDLRLVHVLLDSGADINAPDERGNTPLHKAVLQEHHQTVRLLLARGASTASISDDGETPEMLARLLGCSSIERLFLEKGADEPASEVFGEQNVSRPT